MIGGKQFDIASLHITVELGWHTDLVNTNKFDLDVSAIAIDRDRKLLSEFYFIFYNNTISPDKSLKHSGDNSKSQPNINKDKETISVNTSKINPSISEIIFVATIENSLNEHITFSQITNSYIRIIDDDTGKDIIRYDLDEDFSIDVAIEFGKLSKTNSHWLFEPMGYGYKNGLKSILEKYYKGNIII